MTPLSNQQLLDREYLPVRAKILEIAASLDRLQRAESGPPQSGSPQDDERYQQLLSALEIVLAPRDDRTEQLQLHFSRPYEETWRTAWDI